MMLFILGTTNEMVAYWLADAGTMPISYAVAFGAGFVFSWLEGEYDHGYFPYSESFYSSNGKGRAFCLGICPVVSLGLKIPEKIETP